MTQKIKNIGEIMSDFLSQEKTITEMPAPHSNISQNETQEAANLNGSVVMLGHNGFLSILQNAIQSISSVIESHKQFIEDVNVIHSHFEAEDATLSDELENKILIMNNEVIHNFSSSVSNIANNNIALQNINMAFEEWVKFRDQMDLAFKEYHDQLALIKDVQTKMNNIVRQLEDFETNEDETENNFFAISGANFRKFLSNHIVKSISGHVKNVKDKQGFIQKSIDLTLNKNGKIRPPVGVLDDDTPIYIENISFYHKDKGQILSIHDLIEMQF